MHNILVTGGSRGIGLAIVRALAANGHRAIAIARSETEALKSTAAETRGPGEVRFERFDLGDFDAMPEFVRGLRKRHGPIRGLVNNAGVSVEGLLTTLRTDDIERLVRINTTAPILLTRLVARQMLAAGAGRIVNVSSIVASTGYSGLSAYAATKSSLIGFTRSLARELGPLDITVNAVAPGFVETELTSEMSVEDRARVARRAALRRLPGAEDVAAAVVYLMDAAAANVTGTVLTIDAGATA
ncbi:MAG: SDR family oxidoreductase [Hyphomicrobiales bacterium]|nr:SDR family oxidoreductase [Hyphomicrobiales bacterium]